MTQEQHDMNDKDTVRDAAYHDAHLHDPEEWDEGSAKIVQPKPCGTGMRVSKRSWHYRWWNWWTNTSSMANGADRKEPKNLCSYFWQIVGAGLFTLVLGGGLLFLVAFGVWLAIYWTFIRNTLVTVVVIAAIAISIGISQLMLKLTDFQPRNKPPKPPKEPGIVRAYLRAKKQRICPLIEVVE